MTRIACLQLAPQIGLLAENQASSTEAIRAAVRCGAQVVVLPELATSGYMLRSLEEARVLAVRPDHAVFEAWSEAAGGAVIIGGFCEEGADGLLHNSAAVVDASGVRAVYRKTHLWGIEKRVFSAGNEPPPVIDTPHGRIGVLVCYDLEFPEMTRGLALTGADLIAVPTNWPLVHRPEAEHPPEVIIAMAAARVNRVVVACADRTGTERGQEWTAGSVVIDEAGWIVAEAVDGVAQAEVALSSGRDKRLGPDNDAFADRRDDVYAAFRRFA